MSTINLAGEPLKQTLVDTLYASTSVNQVYDLYGPSEDTTYSTFTLRSAQGSANIGRPLDNTDAYLLDSQLLPVPEGLAGELYLAGAGVSRGYLMRPALTAERYVPNPFGAAGERLYRTGDLVPLTPNGKLDRKALIALSGNPLQTLYQAPQTDLQREVASLWQEVLEVERVGLGDNFFQLGGHSLLATLVVTRIAERLGDKVALKELFAAQTLQAFCERIEALRGGLSPAQDELAKSLEALKRLSLDDLEKLVS